jgi:hypothetical protein
MYPAMWLNVPKNAIKADTGRWNKSLATLRLEQEEGRRAEVTPPEVPHKKMA